MCQCDNTNDYQCFCLVFQCVLTYKLSAIIICITNIPVQGGEAMFKKTLTTRLSELNGARHIGHNVIPVWLEEGYIEIIKLYNPELHWETETTL